MSKAAAKSKSAAIDHRHPLDPLSEAEITLACELLKTQKKLSATTRFAFVQLEEPPKADVLAWKPGKPLMRRAATTVFDTKTGATHIGIVDLDRRRSSSWLEHKTKEFPYGQPPVIIEEFFKVGDIVKKDAGWRKADQAARPDRQGHRTGAGRSVLGRLFRSRGREGPPARLGRQLLSRAARRTTAMRIRSRAWSRSST